MAKVINLRTRRKQAAREAAREAGDRNAARTGLSKAQKALAAARLDKARRELEGKRRERASRDGAEDPHD